MIEKKGNILIASLGESPGVVTSAVDALGREGVAISKVITISTQNTKTCSKSKGKVSPEEDGYVQVLIDEFENYQKYKGIDYIFDCIGSSDIENKSECEDFLHLATNYIKQYQQEDYDVYICVAGGRKSMSALLTIAAQFFGAKAIFHIAITKHGERKNIECNGNSLKLLNGREKDLILHPESAETVPLPFCDLSSFTKQELSLVENAEGKGLLDNLIEFCKGIQTKFDRDIPQSDPTKLE